MISALLLLSLLSTPDLRGSVRGDVVDVQNADLLPGIEVCVSEVARCTQTDAWGRFVLNDLPSGSTLTLSARMAGFSTAELQVVACPLAEARAVRLLLDMKVIIDCTYSGPPETTEYGVCGWVEGEKRAVPHVALRIDTQRGECVWHGESDRDGSFDAPVLEGGDYFLEAKKPGYQSQRFTISLQYCAPYRYLTIPLTPLCGATAAPPAKKHLRRR
jgi:hypothetical protein